MTSLVYSDIRLYRTVMQVLYSGRYRQRFEDITAVIPAGTRSVCDLCFGDTVIAGWCRSQGIEWTGVDLNSSFCARARQLGHHVIEGDLMTMELPPADVYVMAGSLYHFHSRLAELCDRVFARTRTFVVSEPVRNLSASRGPIGWWARRSANPGDAHATFRYNEATLTGALEEQCRRLGLRMRVVSVGRDMLLVMERRTEVT